MAAFAVELAFVGGLVDFGPSESSRTKLPRAHGRTDTYSGRENARRSSVARASAVLRPLVDLASVDLARRVGGWAAPRPADWSYLAEPIPGVALSFAGSHAAPRRHCRPLPPAAAACLLARILSCDLLRVVAQCRKVRILEMKRGAFTDMKAAAVGVLDVGACRERRYRPVRQPRENDQEQADGIGDRGGAAPAVPVENRRTVCQPVHDAALTSGKGRCAIVSGIRPCSAFPAMLPGCNIVLRSRRRRIRGSFDRAADQRPASSPRELNWRRAERDFCSPNDAVYGN